MSASSHPILFIPGPVEVLPELRDVMSMPLIGHRSGPFKAEVQAICAKLKGLFLSEAHTLFENCPATALMEAGVRNLVRGRILHLTCGAFSERWVKVSTACGREAEKISLDWGQANAVDTLIEHLRQAPPYEAVAITHNETSTGVINPLRELAAAIRETAPETLILVDAVTSLGGAELRFDDWGLDLAFAGTQKCLALPPGLCVYAVSERAMAKAATVEGRGFLLDFVKARDGLAAGKTPATPCVPLAFALSTQLDRIASEGLEARWQRHADMQTQVAAWASQQDFAFFVKDAAARSPTVSTLRASGREVSELIRRAAGAGFTLGNGYGKLRDQTFRIGHMGDHQPATLTQLLSALE
ncbi:MAG: alanine--glyoxylate aminotransferase family protein [Planctomycetota bacterium]